MADFDDEANSSTMSEGHVLHQAGKACVRSSGYTSGAAPPIKPSASNPSNHTDDYHPPEVLTDKEQETVVRRRARTHSCFIEERDIELLVTEYKSIDHTYLASMGKHHKTDRWKILVAGLADTIELELNVDKTVALQPRVSIHSTLIPPDSPLVKPHPNKERIFPAFGGKESDRMKEDFSHKWTFRGVPEGFREKHRFEVKPQWGGGGEWFPATLTSRRALDGTYEVKALMVEQMAGVRQEVLLVGVKPADLRYCDTKEPPRLSSRTLLLSVPKDKPHHATLKILQDGSETNGMDVTSLFGRWSSLPALPGEAPATAHCDAKPAALPGGAQTPKKKTSPTVKIQVSRNALGKDIISANVGHTELQHFMSGEVRSVDCNKRERVAIDKTKLKKEWTIQVGPSIEHTISIERKNRMSSIMYLTIDGTRLVESQSQDVTGDNMENMWNCAFRLVGDKFLQFHMADAHTLKELSVKKMEEKLLPADESTAFPDTTSTPIRFTHDCLIAMKDIGNIGKASLYIDGQEFNTLKQKVTLPAGEANVKDMPSEVLLGTFGIIVPRVVVVNSVTRGLAWPVQGLEVASRASVGAYEAVAPVMEEAKVQSVAAVRALNEGLGNFMSSLQSFSAALSGPLQPTGEASEQGTGAVSKP